MDIKWDDESMHETIWLHVMCESLQRSIAHGNVVMSMNAVKPH